MGGIRKEKVLKDRGKGSAGRSHMHCVSPSLSSACLAGYKITPLGGVPSQSYEDVLLALRDSFPLELKTREQ